MPVYTDNTGLPANFKTALSFKAGDVLNIHHLETAFENLKRVPSSAGKYQGDITPSFDNPMWHNDLLHLTYGRDLGNDINKGEYTHKSAKGGSENYSVGYVLPLKNTVFNASASHYTYHQSVAGVNQDYVYGGDSDNISLNASHLAHRDARSKTWLNMGGFTKSHKNYIDDA